MMARRLLYYQSLTMARRRLQVYRCCVKSSTAGDDVEFLSKPQERQLVSSASSAASSSSSTIEMNSIKEDSFMDVTTSQNMMMMDEASKLMMTMTTKKEGDTTDSEPIQMDNSDDDDAANGEDQARISVSNKKEDDKNDNENNMTADAESMDEKEFYSKEPEYVNDEESEEAYIDRVRFLKGRAYLETFDYDELLGLCFQLQIGLNGGDDNSNKEALIQHILYHCGDDIKPQTMTEAQYARAERIMIRNRRVAQEKEMWKKKRIRALKDKRIQNLETVDQVLEACRHRGLTQEIADEVLQKWTRIRARRQGKATFGEKKAAFYSQSKSPTKGRAHLETFDRNELLDLCNELQLEVKSVDNFEKETLMDRIMERCGSESMYVQPHITPLPLPPEAFSPEEEIINGELRRLQREELEFKRRTKQTRDNSTLTPKRKTVMDLPPFVKKASQTVSPPRREKASNNIEKT